MIDSTTSPVPLWKRYAIIAALAIVLVAAGIFIYTKDLHHGGGQSSSGAPAATTPAPSPPMTVAPAATGPKGGIPISSRDPFAQI